MAETTTTNSVWANYEPGQLITEEMLKSPEARDRLKDILASYDTDLTTTETNSDLATTGISTNLNQTETSVTTPVTQPTTKKKKSSVSLMDRGNDKIDKDRFIRNLEYNFDSWLDTLPSQYNDDKKQLIREAYSNVVNGIYNGSVVPELGGFSSIFNTNGPTIRNTTGGFDPYGLVQHYVGLVFSKQPIWEDPDKDKPKSKFSADDFTKLFNKTLFGGREEFDKSFWLQDEDSWNEKEGKRGITNRLKLSVDALKLLRERIVNGDLYADDDDELKLKTLDLIDKGLSIVTSGNITPQDKMFLNSLGIDPDKYYGTGKEWIEPEEVEALQSEAGNTDPLDAQLAEINIGLQNIAKQNQIDRGQAYINWNSIDKNSLNTYALDYSFLDKGHKYLKLYDALGADSPARVGLAQWLGNLQRRISETGKFIVPGTFNGTASILNKKTGERSLLYNGNWAMNAKTAAICEAFYHLRNNPNINQTGVADGNIVNGKMVISSTKDGYSFVYDHANRKLTKVPTITLGLNYMVFAFNLFYPDTTLLNNLQSELVQSNKNGGILKAQFGTYVPEVSYEDAKRLYQIKKAQELKAKQEKELKKLEQEADRQGKTVDLYKASQRQLSDGLTGVDKTRIAAIFTDLAGAVASFTGAGAPIGGGLQLLGTLEEFGADMADKGVSKSEMWKNLGLGLGMSALGFIPGIGGTGKLVKAVNSTIKLLPKILSLGASAGIVLDKDVQNSVSKFLNIDAITDWDSWSKKNKITADDLRHLVWAVGASTGLVRSANYSGKQAVVKKNATTESVYHVTDKHGNKVEISKLNALELADAETLEDAQKIMTKYGKGNVELLELKDKKGLTLKAKNLIKKHTKKAEENNGEAKKLFDFNTISTEKTNYKLDSEDLTSLGAFWLGESDKLPGGIRTDRQMILDDLNHNSFEWSIPRVSRWFVKPKIKPSIPVNSEPPIKIAGFLPPPVKIAGFLPPPSKNKNGGTLRLALQIIYRKRGGTLVPFYQPGGSAKYYVPGLTAYNYNADTDTDWDTDNLVSYRYSDGKITFDKPYTSTDRQSGDLVYNPDESHSLQSAQDLEGNEVYKSFTDLILDSIDDTNNSFKPGSIGESWAKKVDEGTADESSRFYGADGKIRGSWNIDHDWKDVNGNDRKAGNITSLRDYVLNHGRHDNIIGVRHNGFLRKGIRYYQTTADGKKRYVFINNPGDYRLGDPELVSDANDPLTSWTDIEITGKYGPDGKLIGVEPDQPDNSKTDLAAILGDLAHKGFSLGRFAKTHDVNYKIWKNKLASAVPLIPETYNLWSPVTGDYFRQVTTLRGNADMFRLINKGGSRQMTENQAMILEAANKAIDNVNKGYEINDDRIRTTFKDNLERAEDNKDRWTRSFNQAMQNINDNNKYKSNLYNDYKISLNNALQSYLTELLQDNYVKNQAYRLYLINAKTIEIQNKYKSQLEELVDLMKEEMSSKNITAEHTAAYLKYRQVMREMESEIKTAEYVSDPINKYFPEYHPLKYFNFNLI